MSRILLVLAVLLATAGAVVAYGDPHQIARAKSTVSSTVSNLLRPHGATIRSIQTEGAGQASPTDQALSASTNRGSCRTIFSGRLACAPKHVST